MFKLDISNTFSYPVRFTVIDAKGRHQQHLIPFEFKRLSVDERAERQQRDGTALFNELLLQHDGDFEAAKNAFFMENLRQGKTSLTAEQQADHVLEIVEGWKEVADATGPMEFSRANLIVLLNHVHGLYAAINAAFNEALDGPVPNQAARKNS